MLKDSKIEAEESMLSWTEIEENVTLTSWLSPPSALTLTDNNIHVWLARLDQPALRAQQISQSLIEDERIRAERFHIRRDRKRFMVCRGVLRMLLGRYLHIDPKRVQLSYGLYGKPFLAESFERSMLRFNIAHSNELALYAFTRGREIGIDLEYIRTLPDADQIANRFFSLRESAIIQVLPARLRQKAFYSCWTRKEAYLKALGVGLSQALDHFEVSLIPVEPAQLVDVEIDSDDASRWTLKAFAPAKDYVAAVAVEGSNWRNTFWQFQE